MVRRLSLLVALLLAYRFAQAQVVGGTITGTVLDPAGAVVPGAVVIIHNQETGGERRLISDPSGSYTAPSIPVGSYSISVTHDGFAPQTRTCIRLSVGQATSVDVALQPGSVAEQVSVTDTPQIVNVSTEQLSGLVDERQVKDLPLNGRSYDQLITLSPGAVNYTAQRSGGVGISNSSVGNMTTLATCLTVTRLLL